MTHILPQGSLDVQRMINRMSLPHVALLLLKRRVPRDAGMATISYTDRADAAQLACRLTSAGAAEPERLIAQQLQSINKFICSFDLGTDLPSDARIIVIGVTGGIPWELLLELKGKLDPNEDAGAVMVSYYCEPVREGAATSEG